MWQARLKSSPPNEVTVRELDRRWLYRVLSVLEGDESPGPPREEQCRAAALPPQLPNVEH
jgi:hypothetical protein